MARRMIFVVQGDYGQGWEDLTAAYDRREAQGYRDDYRRNDTAPIRMIRRRETAEEATS
jgi:hypothetical protein